MYYFVYLLFVHMSTNHQSESSAAGQLKSLYFALALLHHITASEDEVGM